MSSLRSPHATKHQGCFVTLPAVAVLSLVGLSGSARSETAEVDFGYVSEEELAIEIERRQADIERTERRIADLSDLELKLRSTFQVAKDETIERQQTVVQRTRLFYRLSKSGGSLRYLLGSTSATQFLKRLSLLRHLLRSSLENQRQSNLRYTKISTQLYEVTDEKENSKKVLSELHRVLSELRAAQSRREIATLEN